MTRVIGILALQGNVAEHAAIFDQLDIESIAVRTVDHLSQVSGLVIPGGESTTILHALRVTNPDLGDAIVGRSNEGTLPILAICAGSIVISKEVEGEFAYEPLDLLDISINRNAYGRQVASFRTFIAFQNDSMDVVFIRAPQISRTGSGITVLSEHDRNPVIVQSGDIVAATCHPEQCNSLQLHQYFLQK